MVGSSVRHMDLLRLGVKIGVADFHRHAGGQFMLAAQLKRRPLHHGYQHGTKPRHIDGVLLADVDVLDTLSKREFAAGYAEVVKYGLINDAPFFDWLEAHHEGIFAGGPDRVHAIKTSCAAKAAIVMRDEREEGERALLNFGHTFGHAIETGLGYGQWLHGEAVAAGMALAADLSSRLGMLPRPDVDRVVKLLGRAGLPAGIRGMDSQRFRDLMSVDKKARDGKLRFILLDRDGSARIRADVPAEALGETLALAA